MTTDQVFTTEETPERRPHAEGGAHGSHPTDSTYILIALILFVLTSIEVAMSYLKIEYFTNITLLVLAVAKFSLVAMFFMHLKFDNRVLRRLFLTGIIVAFSVYLVVILTLGVFGGTHK